MLLYAGKYAICAFLQNMRNMLRSHDRYNIPVSLIYDARPEQAEDAVSAMILRMFCDGMFARYIANAADVFMQ